jgi:hypothetical protein
VDSKILSAAPPKIGHHLSDMKKSKKNARQTKIIIRRYYTGNTKKNKEFFRNSQWRICQILDIFFDCRI